MRRYLYHRYFVYNQIHNSFQKHRVQTVQHSNRCYKRHPERKALSRTGIKVEWYRIQWEKDNDIESCSSTSKENLWIIFSKYFLSLGERMIQEIIITSSISVINKTFGP